MPGSSSVAADYLGFVFENPSSFNRASTWKWFGRQDFALIKLFVWSSPINLQEEPASKQDVGLTSVSPKDRCWCHLTGRPRGDGVTPSCTAWQSRVGDLIVGMLGEKAVGRLGFPVFFLWGGVGLTEKASQFFLLKEKIISNFYFQKYSTGFTWVIFWSPKKNGPKRAFIRLIEGLELVQRFLLFAGGQVDLFKMIRKLMWKGIQDDSRCIFSILLCSCDPSGGSFWILRGVQLSQPAVKSRSWRGLYTTQHFQVVHKCVTRWSMKKNQIGWFV